MKNTKKTIITGSLIAGAVFGASTLNASETNLFSFDELGSGSEIRAKLLDQSEMSFKTFILELNCGEDTKKAAKTKKSEDKSKEAKCGEGKCGESKDGKTETKKDTTATKESKSKEAKCGEGEGKCRVE